MDASGGVRLKAAGRGVKGYLPAEDGEEAELQDVKRLVLMCTEPGVAVNFSGAAILPKGKRLCISGQATHDGRRVTWSSTRTVLGPGKQVKVIVDTTD